MVDLGDGLAQFGQPLALAKGRRHRSLHALQCGIGALHLVALARHGVDDGRLRRFRERDDTICQATHRSHYQPVDREIDQSAHDRRYDQRHDQQCARESDYAVLQRRLGNDDLHHRILCHRWREDDPQETPLRREHVAEGAQRAIDHAFGAEIDRDEFAADVDRGRQDLATEILFLHNDRDNLRPAEQLARELFADAAIGRCFNRQRRDLCGLGTLLQPVVAVCARQNRVNEQFGKQDKASGQQQQAAAQAGKYARLRGGNWLRHGNAGIELMRIAQFYAPTRLREQGEKLSCGGMPAVSSWLEGARPCAFTRITPAPHPVALFCFIYPT